MNSPGTSYTVFATTGCWISLDGLKIDKIIRKRKVGIFSESQPILGGRRSTTTTGHVLPALDFCGRGGQKDIRSVGL